MHSRKKPQTQDSAVSELSTEEEHAAAANCVEVVHNVQKDHDDDDTVMVSNRSYTKAVKSDEPFIMIYMGPVLAFLLHDATIAIGTSLLIAAYPTIANYPLILENQIPWSIAVTWILVAFAVGYEVALFRYTPTVAVEEQEDIVYDDMTIPSEIDIPTVPQKRGYSMLRRMSIRFPNLRIRMPHAVKTHRVWSSLTTKRGEQFRWQRRARAPVSDPLMKRLLRNPMYQRSSVQIEVPTECLAPPDNVKDGTKLGAYQLPDADSLKEDVIDPLFVLRGMDIFMTDCGAEDNISQHPFLIQ